MTRSRPDSQIQKRTPAGVRLLAGFFLILFVAGCGQTAETGGPQPGQTPTQPQATSANQSVMPQTQVQQQSYAPDEVLVKFKPETDAETIERIQTELNLKTARKFSSPNLFLMKITDGATVESTIDRLKRHEAVKYAEPNYVVKTTR